MSEEELQPPIEVPFEALSEETLRAVLESFILREGTDYGTEELHFETKIQRLRGQLEKGDVKIVFDPNLESLTLMTKTAWRKLSQGLPGTEIAP